MIDKDKIRKLIAVFLDDYAYWLGNRGCTDTPKEWLDILTEEDLKELSVIYHEYNNSPEDEKNDSIKNYNWLLVRSIRELMKQS